MKIAIKSFKCTDADVTIIPVFEGKLETPNEEITKTLTRLEGRGQFKGEFLEVVNFTRNVENNLKDVIVIGIGKEEDLTKERVRKVYGKVQKKANELKTKKVFIRAIDTNIISLEDIIKASVEGFVLSSYKFDKYKSDKKENIEFEISIGGKHIGDDKINELEGYLQEAKSLAEATIIARDLVNEPSNVIYPETLAKKVESLGKEYGFEVQVFEKDQIEELGMKAFLEVARGSKKKPKLIVMRYFGDKENEDKRLGLVGKGLTYDSGGYSLKPNDGMVTMKSDMGGAAAVIGTMIATAKNKLKKNIIAVVAACENMISGDAYKPGDIIGSMAGKTIEVLNTDAEGRLTLVDAVTYIIEKEKVSEVVDIATLTGAVLVALGTTTTGVVTNNCEFYGDLDKSSKISGEPVWMLPAFDEYKKLIKGDIADLKNIGGRNAGTVTAGLFIGEFVGDKPWLHLDIAGTAWADAVGEYNIKGGTGTGVRTLYELAKIR